jgi:uncharacterized protein YndB with AHSA1/START domain
MDDKPVIVEQIFNKPVAKVWKAITDKDEMKHWYFDLEEFKPETGFEFSFLAGPNEDNQYRHICEITEIIPERKISYSWKYDGYEGMSIVTFELIPEGERTRLKLSHTELETFPESNPDFAKENFIAGWKEIIGTNLMAYLEK